MMGWCGRCRRRSEVEDTSTEVQLTNRGEVAWFVEWLACGHTAAVERGVVGSAPGAPVGLGSAL